MRIYKDFNKVYLENYEPSQIIEIFYNGFFSGDMVAGGNIIVTENKIFLTSIEFYNKENIRIHRWTNKNY